MKNSKNSFHELYSILKSHPFHDQSQVITEICLLTAWAFWSHQKFGSLDFHEQQPDIQYSLNEMANEFSSKILLDRSKLYEICSSSSIERMVEVLCGFSLSDGYQCALDLVTFAQSHGSVSDGVVIAPLEVGRVLADLINTKADSGLADGKIDLFHSMSIAALFYLPKYDDVTVHVQFATPLEVAICVLLGVNLIENRSLSERDPVLIEFEINVPAWTRMEINKSSKFLHDIEVLHAIKEVTQSAAVLVPHNFLFLLASSSIREELIEKNCLDAVVELPKERSGWGSAGLVILRINKHRNKEDKILFRRLSRSKNGNLDGLMDKGTDGINQVSVSLDQIRDNTYDLSFSRYLLGDATSAIKKLDNTVTLEGVADIIRAQSLKYEDASPDDLESFLEIAVKDISESGLISEPSKCIKVDKSQSRRLNNQRVKTGDILLAIKGSVGRVAFVGENCADNWIAGQAFVIIRPRKNTSTAYLYRYLSSELVQGYLEEISTGSAMKMLKASDVSDIPVPLLNAEEQDLIEINHRSIQKEYTIIEEHYKAINCLRSQFWTVD